MAFVPDDENVKSQNGGAVQSVGGAADAVNLSGGAGGLATAGAPTGDASGQSGKPSSSGSYVNLQDYVNANKEQAAQMGSQIAGSLNSESQKASDALGKDQSDFSNALTQSGASLSQDQSRIDSTLASPTRASAADVAAFQNDLNGHYTGPKSITDSGDWSDTQSAVNKAATDLGNTQTETGRDVLLQNQYQRGDYGLGSGLTKLDQALVSHSADAQGAIQGVNSRWGGINDTLNQAVTDSGQAAQKRMADTEAANAYAQAGLGTANTNLQGAVAQQLKDATTNGAAAYSAAKNAIANDSYTADQLKAMGITAGEDTYGADPSAYLHQGAAPTAYQVATADQYAQAAALAKLAGEADSSYLPSQYASQAGTASPYSFDTAAFNSAVAADKAGLQSQVSDFLNNTYGNYIQDNATQARPDTSGLTVDNFATQFPALLQQEIATEQGLAGQGGYTAMSANAAIQNLQAMPQWQAIVNALNNAQRIKQSQGSSS